MTQQFHIPGPLPGLNEILAAAKRRVPWMCKGKKQVFEYTLMKDEWKTKIVQCIVMQKVRKCDGPVDIEFTWMEPNKKRDPDNVFAGKKFVLDALVMAGIIKNDTWGHIGMMTDIVILNKSNPGVMVKISLAQPEYSEGKV